MTGKQDWWQRGTTSEAVESVREYKERRREAANSSDIVPPYFTSKADLGGRKKPVEAYKDLFLEGYESLESLKAGLGNGQFDELIRLVVKQVLDVDQDLVDNVMAKKEFFGVEYYDASEVQGVRNPTEGIHINRERTTLSLLKYDGFHWWFEAEPWIVLVLDSPKSPTVVTGETDVRSLNRRLERATRRS